MPKNWKLRTSSKYSGFNTYM